MSEPHELSDLSPLVDLLQRRNEIDNEIARLIGRPAEKGHVGEHIASGLFDIELESSAVQAGYDGRFRSGLLAGKTVNIKWYAKREGLLDVNTDHLPDYYLVMAGPKTAPASSAGTTRPWLVSEVFLFEAEGLLKRLRSRGVKIGVATSVTAVEWHAARIFPEGGDQRFQLSSEAKTILRRLGETP